MVKRARARRQLAVVVVGVSLLIVPTAGFGAGPRTHHSNKTGHLSALRFEDPSARPKLSPDAFVDRYGEELGLRSRRDLAHKRREFDRLDKTHDTYEQRRNGVRVLGGVLKIHRDADGSVYAANGDLFDVPDDLDTSPTLSAEDAKRRAFAALEPANAALVSSELVIVDPGWYGNPPLGARLTYLVKLTPAAGGRIALFIDARSGDVLDRWEDMPSVLRREVHDAYGDGDECQPFAFPGTLMRAEGDGPVWIEDVDRIYDYAGDFHRLLQRGFGRDSIDGLGAPLLAVTRGGGVLDGCPNAGWFGTPVLTSIYCPGVTADDIVAHEFTHGLIDFTADLLYRNESGMLNESFADIFGEVADLLNGNVIAPGPPGGAPLWPAHPTGPGTDTPNNLRGGDCSLPPDYADGVRWLHAEDSAPYGGATRDMWNPGCFGDPDRAGSLPCCPTGSNGEVVHSGSGIANHAFAIMADGKTFNGRIVAGIGLVKAAAVWYRALTVYLTPLSRLRDAATALDMAASDLISTRPIDPRTGEPGAFFTPDDRSQVANAVEAVEMTATPPCPDQDADWIADACDNCPTIYNPDQANSDRAPDGDACDTCVDADDDGFGNPGFPTNQCPPDNCERFSNPDQSDEDGDGVGDACEDADADGLANHLDNCDSYPNPNQADTDLDDIGDECDPCTDIDADGFGDPTFPNVCPADNCPTVPNSGQGASCVASPANDHCAAAAVTGPYLSVKIDTRTATTEFREPRDPGLGATVWHSFTAPWSGRVCVTAGFPTGYNAQIDVFAADACTFSSAPIDSESFDFAAECREPEIELDIAQGETRLLRIGQRDWFNDDNGGDLALSLEYLDPCLGDCNGNGWVHVDELNTAISIATGVLPVGQCDKADRDGDWQVTVDELVGIAGSALGGCPQTCVAPAPSAAQPSLEIWNATGVPNGTITFPIVLEGTLSEAAAFNIDVQYPSTVITAPVCSKDPRLPLQHALQSTVLGGDVVRWLLTDTSTFPSPTLTDGVVLSCQAQIKSNAPYGAHALRATRTTVSGALGNRIASTVASGSIVVLSPGGGATCSTIPDGSRQLPLELLLAVIPWLRVHLRRASLRHTLTGLVVIAGLLSTALPAQAQGEGGTWTRAAGRKRLSVLRGVRRTWHVDDVERIGPRAIGGRVALVGASFMSVGRFEATISDDGTVSGQVWSGDGEKPVAQIEGGLDGNGFAGAFFAANGERGDWEWRPLHASRLAAILGSVDDHKRGER
jgi:Zn-dependent metalloprotease